jgi:hypothetical protein
MKKLVIFLSTILITAAAFFNFSQPSLGYDEILDQSYIPLQSDPNKQLAIPTSQLGLGQSFKPTVNRLTRACIAPSPGKGTIITLRVTDTTNKVLDDATYDTTWGPLDWWCFYFGPVVVTPNSEYRIYIQASQIGDNLLYGEVGSDGNYERGSALENGVATSKDLHFKIYGYSETATQEPAKKETTTIEPPTNLEASDTPLDEGGSIDLTWKASNTSDIMGYLIYRSDVSGKGYQKIGEVDKSALKYSDATVQTSIETEGAESDQNLSSIRVYYYVVRAYKDSQQSKNSNEAKASAFDNKPPKAPQKVKIKSKGKDFVELSWNANSEEDLLGYEVRYGTSRSYPEIFEAEKNTFAKIENLAAGQTYYFVVVAKDIHNNVSPFSEELEFSFKEINWLWIGSLITLGLISLVGWLIYAYKKRKWPFRKKLTSPPELKME